MNEIQPLIQGLEAQLDAICQEMAPAELAQFRDDFMRLIPEVAAAQDRRATRKALSHLRNVYGRYPAVRDRIMPLPGGSATAPPSSRPPDTPEKELSTAELANTMVVTKEQMDSWLQQSAGSGSKPTKQVENQKK